MSETPAGVQRTEIIAAEPAQSLAGLLGVELPDLNSEGLPLLWHWLHLLDRPRQADLGPDGHPLRGGTVSPPGPGRRRMWAGGRVRVQGPLVVGEPATRDSQVVSTTEKRGRSGTLTFVVVRHAVTQGGRLVVTEEQDLVYRDAAPDPAPDPVAPEPLSAAQDHEWQVTIDPTVLFRFSALTYNSHRIHYDREYARDVERYPGLVTHGPLQAIVMAEAARRSGAGGSLAMDYRLVAPLFDYQGLIAAATREDDAWQTQIRDVGGRVTARATIRPV